jgi:hypothetical protein
MGGKEYIAPIAAMSVMRNPRKGWMSHAPVMASTPAIATIHLPWDMVNSPDTNGRCGLLILSSSTSTI